ncbi:Vacuolar protein-sorting-associated protein [Drechslerella dactyloides]|uniref:Vacuolar protein-sorting-associated protein 36 n=1 Tax=Drechslerella dactyloides TaxID=74499 RepID=A0AAD6J5P4_DREDA|nr:Vacuolar protein-sorting-associated protein [Drechslerella dactyloides]
MAFRKLDLTPALRPLLLPNETLLFVQDAVGLYEGRYKVPNYQNGSAYLTTHRICFINNEEPRKYSAALELKDVERFELYNGFLKSSAKITLFLRPSDPSLLNSASRSASRSPTYTPIQTPPRSSTPSQSFNINRQWICPICTFPNPFPSNFGPAIPIPPCLTCGVKPNRTVLDAVVNSPAPTPKLTAEPSSDSAQLQAVIDKSKNACPRCTFINDHALRNCEICGEVLSSDNIDESLASGGAVARNESPGPAYLGSIPLGEQIDSVKLSFRGGGEKSYMEKLKGAMVQRKWLLEQAPATPAVTSGAANLTLDSDPASIGGTPEVTERVVGIRGLERQSRNLRINNERTIAGAFEDLEALMSRAKEIIALAESFATQLSDNPSLANSDAKEALSNSANLLALRPTDFTVTKDQISSSSSTSTSLYHAELARSVADFLADDRRSILKKEGGAITLVDLWAIYNRARGIELISPSDLENAAKLFDKLQLPVRLRQFKSGLLVVQERNRTDEKIAKSVLAWLDSLAEAEAWDLETDQRWGKSILARDAAEKFGWSIAVATEELEMVEESGVLCREVGIEGVRWWKNPWMSD